MSRTGENIYKRKDGRWEGRYIKERINGKVRYGAVYAKSYREVKEKLDTAKRKVSDSRQSLMAGNVAIVCEKWLEEAVQLKKSTIVKYEDILKRYILPKFGDMELSGITNAQLIDFANYLLREGGKEGDGLAPATVSQILSTMNSLRRYALRRNCQINFSTDCVNLKQEKKEIRVFSVSEEQRLITYLYRHPDRTAAGILLCLYTGIRIGELCALKWDDLDLNEKTLRVCKTMQRLRESETGVKTKVQILQPKSSCSIRTIPIPEAILEMMAKFYEPGTFFLTGYPESFAEPRTIQYRFKRILRECGIKDANFHTTRHTFATRCVELGFDVKSLSEILGHANVSITMNRYVHPSMELKAENMNRFSDLFTVK